MDLKPGEKVYWYDQSGLHIGYVEKENFNTINVFEDDETEYKGFKIWQIQESFLANTPENAKYRWDDYQTRKNEYKRLLAERRTQYHFEKGMNVIVNSMKENIKPYTALILKNERISLIVYTENKKFMKVDKALCEPCGYGMPM